MLVHGHSRVVLTLLRKAAGLVRPSTPHPRHWTLTPAHLPLNPSRMWPPPPAAQGGQRVRALHLGPYPRS